MQYVPSVTKKKNIDISIFMRRYILHLTNKRPEIFVYEKDEDRWRVWRNKNIFSQKVEDLKNSISDLFGDCMSTEFSSCGDEILSTFFLLFSFIFFSQYLFIYNSLSSNLDRRGPWIIKINRQFLSCHPFLKINFFFFFICHHFVSLQLYFHFRHLFLFSIYVLVLRLFSDFKIVFPLES